MADQAIERAAAPASSVEVRNALVDTLRLDLIGPSNAHAFAAELLPEPPKRYVFQPASIEHEQCGVAGVS